MEKEKVNSAKVNELVGLSSKILKIVYFLIIIISVYTITMIMKEWGVVQKVFNFLAMLAPLFIGIVIAWLFDPFIGFLKKRGINRVLGTIITYVLILAVLFLSVYSLMPLLSGQINDFVAIIPNLSKMLTDFLNWIFSGVHSVDISNIANNILETINSFGNDLMTTLPTTILEIAKSFFSGLGSLLVGLIIGFFLLFNFDVVDNHIHNILPSKIRDDYDDLMGSINDAFRKYVHGTLLLSLIIAILSTIFLTIAGVPSPVFFGLFCGLTNLIPYLGPYIGAVPPIIVAFTISPTAGIIAVVLLGFLQFIEGNFLQPIVMSKTMQLHPVTIIVGLLIFGSYFGILGMILATPIMAAIKILWQFVNKKFNLIKQ